MRDFSLMAFLGVFLFSSLVMASGSIDFTGGTGVYGPSALRTGTLGFGVTGQRDLKELSLGYLSSKITASNDQTFRLESYHADFHKRRHEHRGLFWGLRANYFASRAPEDEIRSGLGLAPQAGFDVPILKRITARLSGEWYIFRSFATLSLTLRFHKPLPEIN